MTLLGVCLRHIVHPASVIRRCLSSAKAACPGRYTVKTAEINYSFCRHFCDQQSLEGIEVMNDDGQDDSCKVELKDHVVEYEEPPRSLPPPSPDFLDKLNDRQREHYENILYKYENIWRLRNPKDLKVPTVLTDDNWKHILGFGTSRTVQVLQLIYRKQAKKKWKKEQKQTKSKKQDQNEVIHEYSIPGESSIRAYNVVKAHQAMIHGPELIFDLGFKSDTLVSHIFREERRIRKQLHQLIYDNFKQRSPFHLVFCNVNEKTRSMVMEVAGDVPITITDQCYLQMFSKQELVYLSPDSTVELQTYNHKHVYIVGCITDLETKPLTKRKAEKQRIKYRSFPITKYLGNTTSTLLTLNQVSSILYDLRDTGDWMTALKHVPQRFRIPQEESTKVKKKKKKF